MNNSIFNTPDIDKRFLKNPVKLVNDLLRENDRLKLLLTPCKIRCPGCGKIYFAQEIKGVTNCQDCGCKYDQNECRWDNE